MCGDQKPQAELGSNIAIFDRPTNKLQGLDYMQTKRILAAIYKETGCLHATVDDYLDATRCGSSLLFGEISPEGFNTLLGAKFLDAANASVLYDLGMGLGKLVIQAFLQYPNLKLCVGIELARSRYIKGEEAMVSFYGSWYQTRALIVLLLSADQDQRILQFRHQDMYQCLDASNADIVILETQIGPLCEDKFVKFLRKLKKGCRLLTYRNIYSIYRDHNYLQSFPFASITSIPVATSWSSLHTFYLWKKVI